MTPSQGIEPGPHWWEASALTATPPLLSKVIQLIEQFVPFAELFLRLEEEFAVFKTRFALLATFSKSYLTSGPPKVTERKPF